MATRLAFLGPAGTFAEQAALLHDAGAQLLPFARISAVAAAAEAGMADEGVVPIENSIEGSVNETLDVLIHHTSLRLRRELVLTIEHCLLAAAGTRADQVRIIYSHPQALGQCRGFVERCFPSAQLEPAMSTAAAVQELAQREGAAAIGTRRAAEIYGAEVLARDIADSRSNLTRFVVLGSEDIAPTGQDKTSIAFTVAEDRPGALMEILREFAVRSINLTKIESRPTKEMLGKYIFLVDLEGHRQEANVAEAIEAARRLCADFKVFGSYPRWPANAKP